MRNKAILRSIAIIMLFSSYNVFGQTERLKQALLMEVENANHGARVEKLEEVQDPYLRAEAANIEKTLNLNAEDHLYIELKQVLGSESLTAIESLQEIMQFSKKRSVAESIKREDGTIVKQKSFETPEIDVTGMVDKENFFGLKGKKLLNPVIRLVRKDAGQLFLLINGSIDGDQITRLRSPFAVTETTKTDTLIKDRNIDVSFGKDDDRKSESIKYPRGFGGLTFSRIDWGFSRPMDGGKFSLSGAKNDLSYERASNFGFDLLQVGLRFNDHFKTYLSTGLEWNYLRLKNNILLHQDKNTLGYEFVEEDDVKYKKNVLTSTYLRVPLTFEWRSSQFKNKKRAKIAAGLMTGILLKGTQRLKSEAQGKQKFRDNYSLSSFQYGPFVRFGYGQIGFFTKYYVNDMFENSPSFENLNNLTFGLTLGF